ncbi:unnamed protein product [Peniophora sp. CBMAI 1063]|nr:unnamed protein product [Peniophora sp. CBMAI 1063]
MSSIGAVYDAVSGPLGDVAEDDPQAIAESKPVSATEHVSHSQRNLLAYPRLSIDQEAHVLWARYLKTVNPVASGNRRNPTTRAQGVAFTKTEGAAGGRDASGKGNVKAENEHVSQPRRTMLYAQGAPENEAHELWAMYLTALGASGKRDETDSGKQSSAKTTNPAHVASGPAAAADDAENTKKANEKDKAGADTTYYPSSPEEKDGDSFWKSYLDAAAIEDEAQVSNWKQASMNTLTFAGVFQTFVVSRYFITSARSLASADSMANALAAGMQHTNALLAQLATVRFDDVSNPTANVTKSTVEDIITAIPLPEIPASSRAEVASVGLFAASFLLMLFSSTGATMMVVWAADFEWAVAPPIEEIETLKSHSIKHIDKHLGAQRYGLYRFPVIIKVIFHASLVLFLAGIAISAVPDSHIHTVIATTAAEVFGLLYIMAGVTKLQLSTAQKVHRNVLQTASTRSDTFPPNDDAGSMPQRNPFLAHDGSSFNTPGLGPGWYTEMKERDHTRTHAKATESIPRSLRDELESLCDRITAESRRHLDVDPPPVGHRFIPGTLGWTLPRRSIVEQDSLLPGSLKLLMKFMTKQQKDILEVMIRETLREGSGSGFAPLPKIPPPHATSVPKPTGASKPQAGGTSAAAEDYPTNEGISETHWWREVMATLALAEKSEDLEKGSTEDFIDENGSLPLHNVASATFSSAGDPGPSTIASRLQSSKMSQPEGDWEQEGDDGRDNRSESGESTSVKGKGKGKAIAREPRRRRTYALEEGYGLQ